MSFGPTGSFASSIASSTVVRSLDRRTDVFDRAEAHAHDCLRREWFNFSALPLGLLGARIVAIRRLALGRLLDDLPQLLNRAAAAREPIADVIALVDVRPEPREVENANPARVELARDILYVVASRLIVVATADDVSTIEDRAEVLAPLACAHRIAGSGNALGPKRLDILLALDNEHDVIGGDGLDQLWQSIRDDAHALDGPFLLLGPGPLAELLRAVERFEFENLKQSIAGLVAIVERRLDWAEVRAAALTVGLVLFATAFLARLAIPDDAVGLDLDVEVALAA